MYNVGVGCFWVFQQGNLNKKPIGNINIKQAGFL